MSLRLGQFFGIVNEVAPAKETRRRFGVPIEGPFDRESFTLANALLRKPLDTPMFELLGGSARFVAEARVAVACVGAGARSVVEVHGGEVFEARIQRPGNALYIAFSETAAAGIKLAEPPRSLDTSVLRYLPSGDLVLPSLRVNRASNRMGIRLDGLDPGPQEDMPSEPCCVGAIQRTPSGQLIVVGPSGPTIGGYPKVGYVIQADLDRLAHLVLDAEVSFVPVAWDQALTLDRETNHRLVRTVDEIRLGIGIQT